MARQHRISIPGTNDKRAMVVYIDDKEKVTKVTDENEKEFAAQPIGQLMLEGKPIISVPCHTIIMTQSNPGCVYYFFGGNWYRICS